MRISRMANALLAIALAPTAVTAQKVTYDFQKTTDFAQARSFAIKADRLSENSIVNERIASSIAGELTSFGMRSTDNPDVYVVPSVSSETKQEVTMYPSYGYGAWYGVYGWYDGFYPYAWGPTSYEVRDVRYDTFTIDMVDARTGELLWRGQGVRRMNPYWKPDKVDRKVQKIIAKVLSNFPPGRDDD